VGAETGAVWHGLIASWEGWFLTFLLVVGLPAFGYYVFRRLAAFPAPGPPPRVKLAVYAATISTQWCLAAGMLLLVMRHGLLPSELGQTTGRPGLTWGLALGLGALALAVSALNLRLIRRAGPGELESAAGRLRGILPATRAEIVVFVLMAVTAGICEELLYRGWLVNFLGVLLGSIWIGVVAAALVFGIGHAYQGRRGMVMTGVFGIGFGVLYVLVGSLIPGQVVHAVVDVTGGVVGMKALARLRALTREPAAEGLAEG
jgi:membrane protease YdiL (CAAX protease family)